MLSFNLIVGRESLRGLFYVHNADARLLAPVKVAVPLCLSRHPDNPLDETQILRKAAAPRNRRAGS